MQVCNGTNLCRRNLTQGCQDAVSRQPNDSVYTSSPMISKVVQLYQLTMSTGCSSPFEFVLYFRSWLMRRSMCPVMYCSWARNAFSEKLGVSAFRSTLCSSFPAVIIAWGIFNPSWSKTTFLGSSSNSEPTGRWYMFFQASGSVKASSLGPVRTTSPYC